MQALVDIFHKILGKLKGIKRIHAAIGGFIITLAAICVLLVLLLNMQARYTRAAEGITEQIFQKLIAMDELFSYVDAENVDIRNKLIPQMRMQYFAAVELNNALVNGYGEKYRVLSLEQIEDFDSAFKEYNTAIASGLSLNLARDDMALLLAEVRDMINARYNPTPEPTTTPVVIGAEQ